MDLTCYRQGCWWLASFWQCRWKGEVLPQPSQQWGLAAGRWREALLGGTENVAEGWEDGMRTGGQREPQAEVGEPPARWPVLAMRVLSDVCLMLQPALPPVCTPAPED